MREGCLFHYPCVGRVGEFDSRGRHVEAEVPVQRRCVIYSDDRREMRERRKYKVALEINVVCLLQR
jgi:hypothetical protein